MKTKKIITAMLLAGATLAATISVAAENLTNTKDSDETEVTARILGEDEPGAVSYIVSIPDKIDFGTLVKPANAGDSFVEIPYTVRAEKITGLDDAAHQNWYVRVQVRDKTFELDEQEQFYLTQKTVSYPEASNGKKTLIYTICLGDSNANVEDNASFKNEHGFNMAFFHATGDEVTGKFRLNQHQLYGKDLNEYAGEYSGSAVFHTSIVHSTAGN